MPQLLLVSVPQMPEWRLAVYSSFTYINSKTMIELRDQLERETADHRVV
jgi:hypothetical protein